MTTKTKESAPSVDSVLTAFQKQGFNFGYTPKENKFFSTSNLEFDCITGGGIPVGKVVEFYGKSMSGKTTAALQVAAGILQSEGKVVWTDYERAFDAEYASALGVDTSDPNLLYFKPRSLEQGGDATAELINTGEIDLVVVDSTARMTTESELSGSMADLTVADKAKGLYKYLRKILNALDDNNATIIFLNHILEQINTSMPNVKSTTTPGGNAVPYFASLRCLFTVIQSYKANEEGAKYKAVDVEVLVTKNRAGKPFQRAVLRNDFGSGFSNIRSALNLAEPLGIVSKGPWTKVNDPELATALGFDKLQGWDNFVLALTQNVEARGILISKAYEALRANG